MNLDYISKLNEYVEHPDAMTEAGTCGECATQICMAEAARQLKQQMPDYNDKDDYNSDNINKWSSLWTELWQNSKYYLLYQQALKEEKNPAELFQEKGWTL